MSILSCTELSIYEGIHIVETIFYILAKTVQIFLSALSLCMFMSVILQFFVDREGSRLYRFFGTISEIFVYPFRVIMAKFHLFENTPIDMPFLVAYITLSLVTMILPTL